MQTFASPTVLAVISHAIIIAERTGPVSAEARISNIARRINEAVKIGGECNDFDRLTQPAYTSGEKNDSKSIPDTGILKCEPISLCAEDSSSSLGGRCVAAAELRSLQTCVKCVGLVACEGLSQYFVDNKIGCNSCIGDYACGEIDEAVSEIGDGSCIGYSACYRIQAVVGDGSCLEEPGGTGKYEEGYPCMNFEGTINHDSCVGYSACYQFANDDYNFFTEIGEGSCRGRHSCEYLFSGTSSIGTGSCNEPRACYQIDSPIGHYSCNGGQACYKLNDNAPVGHYSCNSLYACRNSSAAIGSCNCNEESECENNDVVLLDQCKTPFPKPKSGKKWGNGWGKWGEQKGSKSSKSHSGKAWKTSSWNKSSWNSWDSHHEVNWVGNDFW